MKIYQFKIQWIFSTITEMRDLCSVIRILGARSLTKIIFRDLDMKVIGDFPDYPFPPDETEPQLKWLKKQIEYYESKGE